MGKFSKASSQARSVIHSLQNISEQQRQNHEKMALPSLGTARDFQECLTHVGSWMKANHLGSLRELSKDLAISYLEMRAEEIGQKALDQERQAMQKMLQVITHQLSADEKLPVIKSIFPQVLEARAYSKEQMLAIAAAQTPPFALATELAYASGLRAHELLTLRPIEERPPDERPASDLKFTGRPKGKLYTVKGKGGLVRVVSIPIELSERLEKCRLATSETICDRTIYYKKFYDVAGGKSWSNSFSKASSRVLEFSNGAHGLRHAYAQDRMLELQKSGCNRQKALEVVSQELGHFRPEITETYLR